MSLPNSILLSYASGRFVETQDYQMTTARRVGGLKHRRACSPRDIPHHYREQHRKIFTQKRGDGYWLWKPFLIRQTMAGMRDGDVLFYCDSGSYFISPADPLIQLAAREPSGIICFKLTHLEKRFTKRAAFVSLGVDHPAITDSTQVMASFILFRVGDAAREFVGEWLGHCENELLVTDAPSPPPLVEYPEFSEHRHDQSLFSLVAKRRGLRQYPDPSQWGNDDPERPPLYPQILQHVRGGPAPGSSTFRARVRRSFRKISAYLQG